MSTTTPIRAGQGAGIDPDGTPEQERMMATTTRIRAGQGNAIDPDG
ncbi:MAG TPA: hypothetical protein VEX86_10060 [Longimicrobium sp.]|nr:hypothetical protein [Longimicrobium sp.]